MNGVVIYWKNIILMMQIFIHKYNFYKANLLNYPNTYL